MYELSPFQAETDGGQPCLDLLEPPRNDRVDEGKDLGKQRTKGKVTFALQKNTVRNTPQDEGIALSMFA